MPAGRRQSVATLRQTKYADGFPQRGKHTPCPASRYPDRLFQARLNFHEIIAKRIYLFSLKWRVLNQDNKCTSAETLIWQRPEER
jgi:hypothetical protein